MNTVAANPYTTPSILIQFLAAGLPQQVWIDCVQRDEAIRATIDTELAKVAGSDSDSVDIIDSAGFGNANDVSCYLDVNNLKDVSALAHAIETHGLIVLAYLIDIQNGINLDILETLFVDNYLGEYISLADYAKSTFEADGSLESVPTIIENAINWDVVGRDLAVDSIIAIEVGVDEVHVFRNS